MGVEEIIEKLMNYQAKSLELYHQGQITEEEMESKVIGVHIQLIKLNDVGVNV